MTSAAVTIGDVLESYAERGIFSGFSRQPCRGGAGFIIRWHRGQQFHWVWNDARQTLRIGCVLPQVPAASPMYREFKAWLRARQDDRLPEHRRCDPAQLTLRTYNRKGDVALTGHVVDGAIDYAVRKMVSLVNEIYLDFLSSGLYFEWLIETFDLDPDNPR